jgi:hypothetical protein
MTFEAYIEGRLKKNQLLDFLNFLEKNRKLKNEK